MRTASPPLQDVAAGYDGGDEERLATYSALTATFGVALTAALVALRIRGRELPERASAGDLLLAGIATHKLSRLVSKDRVTSFVRAPFTRREGSSGHGEVEDAPRGRGVRRAIGELLVCPFCLAQWIAAALAVGFVAAPRLTRFVAGIYVAETLSDALQLAYKAAEERV